MLRLFLILSCLCAPLCGQRILIGIAGGTGSGKTTMAQKIHEAFPDHSVLIYQDSYYKDLSHLTLQERAKTNFDHPDSLDFEMLRQHLLALKKGQSIEKPLYNFCTHRREEQTQLVKPAELIIVEGILLFAMVEIRELFDVKIFLDTDDDIRLLRRMERDMTQRSRDFNSIKEQYLATVKPMHDAFVFPSKKYADMIIPVSEYNQIALDCILSKLHADLRR